MILVLLKWIQCKFMEHIIRDDFQLYLKKISLFSFINYKSKKKVVRRKKIKFGVL